MISSKSVVPDFVVSLRGDFAAASFRDREVGRFRAAGDGDRWRFRVAGEGERWRFFVGDGDRVWGVKDDGCD